MSEHHHHHPHEGHSDSGPGRSKGDHLHHNWFFYVAGFFLLLALLAFIFSGNLAFQPTLAPQPEKPPTSVK